MTTAAAAPDLHHLVAPRSDTAPSVPPARIALYSHDSTGLGHVRRNLLIAQQLAGDGHDVLLISGSPEAAVMARPPATDIVTLPALGKDEAGTYRSRHLHMNLRELTALRRDILTTALSGFAPDVLIVDRHARGFRGELEPALDRLVGTRVVLGLRDVLDDAPTVRREWHERRIPDALRRWYDEIWVYGDPRLHDPIESADLVAPVPVHAVGYLNAERPASTVPDHLPLDRPFVLCMLGGGADGVDAAEAVLQTPLPEGIGLLLVTGPQMPGEARTRLESLAADHPLSIIVTYVHDPVSLLDQARAAIVMGGYNTTCEVLASETPTLVLPRVAPRLEQRIRADMLAEAGFLDTLSLASLDEGQLAAWLRAAVASGPRSREGLRLDGLAVVGERTRQLVAASRLTPARPVPATTSAARTASLQGVRHVAV